MLQNTCFFNCQLENEVIALVSICAPNTGQVSFLSDILNQLDKFKEGGCLELDCKQSDR